MRHEAANQCDQVSGQGMEPSRRHRQGAVVSGPAAGPEMVSISRDQARQYNDLLDLLRIVFTARTDSVREEALSCVKSLVIGNHITPHGLYRGGVNLRP